MSERPADEQTKAMANAPKVNGTKDVPATVSVGAFLFMSQLDGCLAQFEHNANTLLAIAAPEQSVLFWRRAQEHFLKTRDRLLGQPQPSIIVPEPKLVVP